MIKTTDNTTIDYPDSYINTFGTYDEEYISNYEEDLRRRQEEHLKRIANNKHINWQPCMHDSCQECLGTGIRRDGTMCIHSISCPCSKCNPTC